MSVNKSILGLAVTGQSIALAKKSLKLAKKRKKKRKLKEFIKAGATTIVGVNLLKPQADVIAGM